MMEENQATENENRSWKPDCENCFGLCCVALPFGNSAEFAEDKEGGKPCRNLLEDYRCGIHQKLRRKGFKGCTVFECFGAGQKVSQFTFKGVSWQENKAVAMDMFKVFPIMQQLHEMLCYLDEALQLQVTKEINQELEAVFQKTSSLTELKPEEILNLNIPEHRTLVNELLMKTSELLRQDILSEKSKRLRGRNKKKGSDLIGANLRNLDLRGENFRGAWLIAADLRKTDLRFVDFIGADLRDADIRGADLRNSLFLTQVQLNAANGDKYTKIPAGLNQPAHWFY
ncbi:pentapeptide repeat-containing protein [Niallia circulans]|uniref:Pentapeptide repeat-containing protein n=1 Tax=Niallia circulans TaxID=1397 RepID=A0A553SFS0_NIACI|nr:pentapeptide repeat-containing protein [Niallia circulans]TRZ35821.1 pentapeptide repeat-containing protein [Niallia circulans]